jgi:hypothetical protein
MKTTLSPKASSQGTTLLVALFLTTILAVTIGGYLKHAYQQHYLGMRSQVWNSSIAVSESGIEEAMQQLNTNPTNLATYGWEQNGNQYTMKRPLGSKASYTVVIDTTDKLDPTITSLAHVTPPTLTSAGSGSGSALAIIPVLFGAALNGEVVTAESTIRRAIQVKCSKDSLFLMAMVAKSNIVMNGNGVMTDSFNSSMAAHSSNGLYPKDNPSKLLSNGDVASNLSIQTAIDSGNANIYGHVSVGAGGSVYVGPKGGVGEYSWVQNNQGMIQEGYFSDDMNFNFWSYPWTAAPLNTPLPNTISTTTYEMIGNTNEITSSVHPVVMPVSGVTTNAAYTTVNVLPSPTPFGSVTNNTTKKNVSKDLPADGTYVGTVHYNPNSGNYTYDEITATTYTYPSFTYTYTLATAITNSTTTSVDYDYVLYGSSAGFEPVVYTLDSIPTGSKVYVTGNAKLMVAGNVKLSGDDDGIYMASDAKLKMVVNGDSVSLGGNGVVNPTGYAANFSLYCTDNVTSLSLSGNGEFTGIIYAPTANVALNGGGSEDFDFIGAVVANYIQLNGHFKFHYDEALKGLKDEGRYKVTTWDEISIAKFQ